MDFYSMSLSAPCRSVLLVAKALGLKLNVKNLNLMKDEQLKPAFVAINPQHTVPTLVDGDMKLWESRAILTYLATKYGKDSLYSKDVNERAAIDRLLYFDMGTLYHRFGEYVYPVMFHGETTPKPDKLEKLQEALGYLNLFLEGHEFAVGNRITVADHALVSTISTMAAAGINLSNHSNIVAWFARCKKQMPGYITENEPGALEFGKFAKSKGL